MIHRGKYRRDRAWPEDPEAAKAMGVSRGTVKSATSRGIAALARILKEES